jgi:type II secretory pathway component GspD/PulD (secretin)
MTLDNQAATIELIEQIPYTQQTTSTESSSAISTTAFKEAGIKLSVTPHITTKDNYISMNLQVEQSFRSGYTPDNQPIIDSRKANTNLLVRNGETIVIGGLRKKEDSVTLDKVPVLGDIPVLGGMFRRKSKAITDVDLLIFVTPKIVVEPQLTETERSRLEMFTPSPDDEKRFNMLEKKPKNKTKPAGEAAISEEKAERIEENNFHLRPPS